LNARWVADIGTSRVTEWRESFATNSLKAWHNHEEVWVCRGLLDSVPESRWGWIEGADSRITWLDIYGFFSRLETSEVRGDFVRMPPTQANIKLLQGFVERAGG